MITTENHAWGFYGTLRSNEGMDDTEAAAAYHAVASEILVGKYGMEEDEARRLLDSKIGRHLADAMHTRKGFSMAYVPGWLPEEILRWYAGD